MAQRAQEAHDQEKEKIRLKEAVAALNAKKALEAETLAHDMEIYQQLRLDAARSFATQATEADRQSEIVQAAQALQQAEQALKVVDMLVDAEKVQKAVATVNERIKKETAQ